MQVSLREDQVDAVERAAQRVAVPDEISDAMCAHGPGAEDEVFFALFEVGQ